MLEGWGDYYFMIGTAAGGLIGLLFVVATLSAGRDRSTVETGSRLFTTPLVAHLGGILLLSGATLAPPITPTVLALLSGGIALAGVAGGIWIALGIFRFPYAKTPDWFDVWWYGIIPAILYALLGGAAAAILTHSPWAEIALATAMMALLLTTIHNAWDLVTFLAPRAEPPAAAEASREDR